MRLLIYLSSRTHSLIRKRELAQSCALFLTLCLAKNGEPISSAYFTKNVFETSPDAVVTVSIARPLRPPLGTVAEILLSLSVLNVAAWPGPNETLRRQSLFPKFVPVIVTLSPALPSSGLTFSMSGAMPKQAGAFPEVSAL